MAKQILDIKAQIERLKFKKIFFTNTSEEERCKKLLLKYNYLNVAALKYIFASGKGQKNHVYFYHTSYNTLEKNYLQVLKLENELRESVLTYETELKVHLTLFLLQFLANEGINFSDLLSRLSCCSEKTLQLETGTAKFSRSFQATWKAGIEKYSGHSDFLKDYHLLIKILTFGSISKLLGCDYTDNSGKKEMFFIKFIKYNKKIKFVKRMEDLNSIVILRNSLCHKESLITFLDKGWRENHKQGSIRTRDFLNERQNAIAFIYEYNYGKKMNLDSIFLKFNQYRLKNKGVENFKNIIIK